MLPSKLVHKEHGIDVTNMVVSDIPSTGPGVVVMGMLPQLIKTGSEVTRGACNLCKGPLPPRPGRGCQVCRS